VKKGYVLKVIERHQILMLAINKQISQRKAAEELGLSLSHIKLLLRRLNLSTCVGYVL
jgi:Trp operon repressor